MTCPAIHSAVGLLVTAIVTSRRRRVSKNHQTMTMASNSEWNLEYTRTKISRSMLRKRRFRDPAPLAQDEDLCLGVQREIQTLNTA